MKKILHPQNRIKGKMQVWSIDQSGEFKNMLLQIGLI